jgi:hypothetical protein
MDDPRARYLCLADGCGFRWEEPGGREPIVQPDPEKPGKTYSTWPQRTVVCPACEHPYVRWENYEEHDWNASARSTHNRKAAVSRRRSVKVMHGAALMLPLAFLLANGVAADPVTYDEDVQEFIAEMRARANEQTTVFVHLDEDLSSVESMVDSVIGALVLPCNPMWAEGCEIPMEPLVRMLRDAGAPLPVRGLPCDRATLHTLEACLPGFEVSPSPNGEQLYLTTRRPAAAAQSKPWHSYVGENVASTVGSIEGRGFKCHLSFTSVDRAVSEYMATIQLSPSEIVVLSELQEFHCSQQVVGFDFGYRTVIRGKGLGSLVTSLILDIENASDELRRQVYDRYSQRAIDLRARSELEESIRLNPCFVTTAWDQNRVELLAESLNEVSIFVIASTDQMVYCVAYVHPKSERARRDKIYEVERRLWDEIVQPDVDEGKRRQLKSGDF